MRLRIARSFSLALVAAAVVTLAGCAFFRGDYNGGIESDRIGFIQKGVTTRSEVAAKLGVPDEVTFAGGREIHHYRHYEGKAAMFIPILFNIGRVNVQSDDLYVFYTDGAVVEDVIYGNRTEHMEFRWWPFGE